MNINEIMIESQIEARGITDKKVLDALSSVPRDRFVPGRFSYMAYEDNALPIGYGQTISQPYIVALMSELLKVDCNSTVLEIGTGSGYQAAVLSRIVKRVYTVEIIEELHETAKETIKNLNYRNIEFKLGDGYHGWEEHAPYDAIIVTCAAESVPQALIKQLKAGGKLCIPVGMPSQIQELLLIERTDDEHIHTKLVTEVMFVPLTRKEEKE